MTVIKKSAVVPYEADQMYELVNDVESYPDFLPWCRDTAVYDKTDTSLRASLTLATGSIKQSFTTENTMQPGRRIDVCLVSGPFKYLRGDWQFEPVDYNRCRISLEMEFEFKNRLLKMALSKIFNHIIETLVEAFTERAQQVYGHA